MLRQRKAVEETEILDEIEQEEVINKFKRSQEVSDKVFRYSLLVGGLVFALLKVLLSFTPLLLPDLDETLPMHRGMVGHWPLLVHMLIEFLGALSFLSVAVLSVRPHAIPHLDHISVALAIVCGLVGSTFLSTDFVTLPYALWYGLMNLVYTAAAFYADHSLRSTRDQISALEGLRYSYKRL